MAGLKKRFGRRDGLISLIEPVLLYGGVASVLFYVMMPYIYYAKNETFIMLSLFALWRYGWLLLNSFRAIVYAKYVYPKLKKKITALDDVQKYPQHIYFAIPSYKEEDWVSVETFKSIMNELSRIPSSATIIVATSGDPNEDALIYQTCKAHHVFDKVELVFQHQKEGKRIAMGHSIRAIARRYFKKDSDYNSVTFFMDGDSYLEKGFFEKLLPHFAIDAELGALTTNEAAYIRTNSNWYKDWFNLKFGQRHTLFQSHSLSKKVLTLTGRLSAYRTDIIVQEKFISKIENDIITTVMHGKFRFLMGDDKTTWFNVLELGWNMRYLPDVLCYSLESRDAEFLDLSRSLPYRWYGNTLRNSGRALALGPRKIKSFFIWWSILDQRISMWTSLVGLTGTIILGFFEAYFYFLFYIVWILYVRLFQISIIAYNGHPVSIRTIPLMLYTQWLGSLVKIKALFNLSDQKWSKGGEVQKSDDSIAKVDHPLFEYMPDFLMFFSYSVFIYVMLLSHDVITLPDLDVLKEKKAPIQREHIVKAGAFGVIADDGKDDAAALNKLVQNARDGSVIELPQGVLDFYTPLLIQRSNITLRGTSKTKIISHLKLPNKAAIYIKGEKGKRLGYLTHSNRYGDSVISTDISSKQKFDWIKLREPNDAKFFNEIHSLRWRKKYPYLRQEIVQVHKQQKGILYLENSLTTLFESGKTEIYQLEMLENIHLQNFSIEQEIPGANPQKSIGVYVNMYPEYTVDMVHFEYVAASSINNVNILNAGNHPLVFENVHGCIAKNLSINGAWNKGKKGRGYVRFARAFSSKITDSTIKNIRHLTLQWSSANNTLQNLKMGVDINLHGGYSHDNEIENITFSIPQYHKWDGITLTPPNAKWASPDGPRNYAYNISYE